MKRSISILLLFLVVVFMLFVGCEDKNNSSQVEKKRTEKNHAVLMANQPAPFLKFSLERANLIKRLNRWNNPNKVSYIYLFSMGRIVSFYAIKGKVSSVNSLLTSPKQIVRAHHGSRHVVPSPDFDGSYGSNGNAIFFFKTDGTYVEWNGKYLLCDRPMKVRGVTLLISR